MRPASLQQRADEEGSVQSGSRTARRRERSPPPRWSNSTRERAGEDDKQQHHSHRTNAQERELRLDAGADDAGVLRPSRCG